MKTRFVASLVGIALITASLSTTRSQSEELDVKATENYVAPAAAEMTTLVDQWSQKNEALKQKLEGSAAVEFFVTPLEEACAFLSESLDNHILIDYAALEQLGLDSSLPITMKINNVAWRSALDAILDPHELTYYCKDGILVITSWEKEETQLETHIYDVQNLMNPSQPLESIDALQNLITTTVKPNSWAQAGGPGSIVSYQATLVVSQTQRNQESIAKLLRELDKQIASAGGPVLPFRQPNPGLSGGRFGPDLGARKQEGTGSNNAELRGRGESDLRSQRHEIYYER